MMHINKAVHFFFLLGLLLLTSFSARTTWQWSESKSMGYKIEFPQKPEESLQDVDSEIGKLKLNIKSYEVTEKSPADDNLMYLINCTVFPDSIVNSNNTARHDGFFRGTIDGAVKKIGGKLISEKKISLQGDYPGREVQIDFNEGNAIIYMRLYLVNNKLFMLETITETAKAPNTSITRFLNSFQLL
jgi:hypothetical protein